ncbi:MAG: hypothetical protein ACI4PP_02945 [Clostridia bacterium]
MKDLIDREDWDVISRALNMAAIDDEKAGLILVMMVLKKDKEIHRLRAENEFIRDKLRRMELEEKQNADI